jgi:hypothetical protein
MWEGAEKQRLHIDASMRKALIHREISLAKSVGSNKIKKLRKMLTGQLAQELEQHRQAAAAIRQQEQARLEADKKLRERLESRQKRILLNKMQNSPQNLKQKKQQQHHDHHQQQHHHQQQQQQQHIQASKSKLTETDFYNSILKIQCLIRRFLARKKVLKRIHKLIAEIESHAAAVIAFIARKFLKRKSDFLRKILRLALRRRAAILSRNLKREKL